MAIYSPFPPDLIWQTEASDKMEIAEEIINGIPVQLLITGDKTARIERIISTNPMDFLKITCQPGQNVSYRKAILPDDGNNTKSGQL